MSLETITETQQRLAEQGFVDDLIAQDGQLRSTRTRELFAVDSVVAVETIRYEGSSDPEDEAILIAVATKDGRPVGTFTTPFGPQASADQAEVLTHLHGPGSTTR